MVGEDEEYLGPVAPLLDLQRLHGLGDGRQAEVLLEAQRGRQFGAQQVIPRRGRGWRLGLEEGLDVVDVLGESRQPLAVAGCVRGERAVAGLHLDEHRGGEAAAAVVAGRGPEHADHVEAEVRVLREGARRLGVFDVEDRVLGALADEVAVVVAQDVLLELPLQLWMVREEDVHDLLVGGHRLDPLAGVVLRADALRRLLR